MLVHRFAKTHILLLNKFPVYPNHTIVATKDFVFQGSPNTGLDLYTTYKVLQAMNGFGFFNSCVEGINFIEFT